MFVEPDVKAVDCKRIQGVREGSLAYNVTTYKCGDDPGDDDDDDDDDIISCVGRLQNSRMSLQGRTVPSWPTAGRSVHTVDHYPGTVRSQADAFKYGVYVP